MEDYSENFRAHVERLGYIPDSFLRVKPQTAIEAVAMRLTSEAIQETTSPARGPNSSTNATTTPHPPGPPIAPPRARQNPSADEPAQACY
jgi:hypothetical protein